MLAKTELFNFIEYEEVLIAYLEKADISKVMVPENVTYWPNILLKLVKAGVPLNDDMFEPSFQKKTRDVMSELIEYGGKANPEIWNIGAIEDRLWFRRR